MLAAGIHEPNHLLNRGTTNSLNIYDGQGVENLVAKSLASDVIQQPLGSATSRPEPKTGSHSSIDEHHGYSNLDMVLAPS